MRVLVCNVVVVWHQVQTNILANTKQNSTKKYLKLVGIESNSLSINIGSSHSLGEGSKFCFPIKRLNYISLYFSYSNSLF